VRGAVISHRRAPTWSRMYALGVLGLTGTGALFPRFLRGALRVRRGGVRLVIPSARQAQDLGS